MSLINQMLQDLDKRGADAMATEPMYSQIRPVSVPPARKTGRLWLALAVLGAIVAWLLWTQFLPGFRQRQELAPLARVAPAAAPAPAPAVAPNAAAQSLDVPAPPTNLPPMADLPLLLKLSSGLDKTLIVEAPAQEKNPPPAVVAKIERVSPEPLEKTEKNKTVSSGTPAKPLEQSPASAKFAAKFVKETTPQQQAESEYRQATILQQQGRINEAVAMFEQALKSDPQHGAARQSLIALLLDSKRHDDAIRLLQQGLTADRNQPGLAMILARLQVEKGRLGNAIDTLQRSLPHAQDRADFLAFLAALQQRESHHKEAVDLYQQALKKNPQNAVWWMGLGISFQADGRGADALDAYQRARSGNGLSPDLLAFVEQKITQLQR